LIARRAALAALLLVALLLGCGGRSVGAGEQGSSLERVYPALRWVPADAGFVAVAARSRDGAVALRHLTDLAALGGAALGAVLPDLAAAGVDPDRSAAVFGLDGYPTAVLPVADPVRLRDLLDRQPAVSERGGLAVHSSSRGGVELSWFAVDDWAIVHAGPGLAWVDRVQAGARLGADPLLAAAVSRGRRGLGGPADRAPALVGMVRTAALARDAVVAWPALAACAGRAAPAVPHLVWAADVSSAGGDAWAAIDLAPGAAAALRAHVARPAPPGYYEIRSGAPLALDWSVDLGWLEHVRAGLGCSLLAPIDDPVRAATGFAGPLAWHVAARSIDTSQMAGEGAAHLLLADPGLIEAQLESIPGRSLFERSRKMGGVSVRVLSVPGLPTVVYRLDGARFTVAVGDGVMEEVLADRPAPRDVEAELVRVHLEPSRVPDLSSLAGLVGGRRLGEGLTRYDEVSLSAQLDGDSVAVFARLRLSRSGRGRGAQVRRATLW
jgi:hypothetical protein